jgi:hypothetical protein
MSKKTRICGEKDGLYTWANIKIGKDICVEKIWIYTRQITK